MLKKLGAAILMVVTSFAVLGTSGAIAAPADNPPARVVPGSPSLTTTVIGAKASASDIATGQVVVLADMFVKASVKTSSSRCYWTKGGFWNSGRGLNGHPRSFWDQVPGKLCPSKKSKSGWVKVAGGTSGRNCGNVASSKKPPFRVVAGKVLMVRSFASVRIKLHAQVKVAVSCDSGVAKAYGEGSGEAWVIISLKQYVQARGEVENGLFISAVGQATAQASARAECSVPPPPPPPPAPQPPAPQPPPPPSPPPPPPPPPANRPPTVSIVGPQHVYVGGTVTYCVTASDPDGDTLTYSFTTNYGSVVGNGNCYTYQAPQTPGEGVTVTVTVNDGKGGLASATTAAFPVVKDDFGG